jgi:hypothetical protein
VQTPGLFFACKIPPSLRRTRKKVIVCGGKSDNGDRPGQASRSATDRLKKPFFAGNEKKSYGSYQSAP